MRCRRNWRYPSRSAFRARSLDAYDAGELDAVVVRQEGSRRGGEKLTEGRIRLVRRQALRLAPRRDVAAGDAGAALRRARDRRPRARQGRHRLDRDASSAAASPRWPPPPWPALRSPRWPGGSRRQAWSISARPKVCRGWHLQGDAALEGQRPRQTGGLADPGGDVSKRRGRRDNDSIADKNFAKIGTNSAAVRLRHLGRQSDVQKRQTATTGSVRERT